MEKWQAVKGLGRMIYDIHAHVIFNPGDQNSNYLCSRDSMSYGLRLLNNKIQELSKDNTPENMLVKWIDDSKIDRVVLLALDAAYYPCGNLDKQNTLMVINNEYIAKLSLRSSKIMFGASVHPYRKDAISEIARLAKMGACLMKWIPSAQNIEPDNKACFEFYEALAEYKMPLLTHIGVEHALPKFNHLLNDPRKLKPALERGVTVIGAHCGTRMFLYEKSYFKCWERMALDYEKFYGDISTFTLPLHYLPLRAIMKNSKLLAKILYASDFPASSWPLWYSPTIGFKKALQLQQVENPFDKPYLTTKRMGVPDEVYTRADKILRFRGVAHES